MSVKEQIILNHLLFDSQLCGCRRHSPQDWKPHGVKEAINSKSGCFYSKHWWLHYPRHLKQIGGI